MYSGKSTLILTLLNLLNLQSGSILIDGVDISYISRTILRRQCFITIPQQSFLVADASLRFNLDPENLVPDDVLVSILKTTKLWRHFCNNESPPDTASESILDHNLIQLPPLSTGQQQLLSLSYALARLKALSCHSDMCPRKPILILDEATASLDLETEFIMQEVIQKEFTEQGLTVICITHRASTKGLRSGLDAVASMKDGYLEHVIYMEESLLEQDMSKSASSDGEN
jgi:ABC-type multidrug transport system fused ATPase/permease subunit